MRALLKLGAVVLAGALCGEPVDAGMLLSAAPAGGPVSNTAPNITPTTAASTGVVLTCNSVDGNWTPSTGNTYTQQFFRSGSGIGTPVAGHNTQYTTATPDVGNPITCKETATDAGGSTTSNPSNAVTVPGGPIAFVGAGALSPAGSTSPTTYNYAISSGTNEGLVICVATSAQDITAVTYNSVAATLVLTGPTDATFGGAVNVYYLPLGNTSAGSHAVSISSSTNHYLASTVTEYSHIQQTTTPDATNSNHNTGTSSTVVVTTVTPNAWVVLCGGQAGAGGASAMTAGAGDTLRISAPNPAAGITSSFDTAAPVTTPGANSFTINGVGTAVLVSGVALKPG